MDVTKRYLGRNAKVYFISAQSFASPMDYDYESLVKLKEDPVLRNICRPNPNFEHFHTVCEKVRKGHIHTGAGHVHPEALFVALWFTGLTLEGGQDDDAIKCLNEILKVCRHRLTLILISHAKTYRTTASYPQAKIAV